MIFHILNGSMGTSFRDNLKSELDYQDIKINEFSARVGIPLPTMEAYLGPKAAAPSVYNALKIARALNVTVDYLITGEEANTKTPQKKTSKEAREVIRRIETLNAEQCKAILGVISSFDKNVY